MIVKWLENFSCLKQRRKISGNSKNLRLASCSTSSLATQNNVFALKVGVINEPSKNDDI